MHLHPLVALLIPTIMALPRVLVYTATAGYRHASIPTAIETLGELGPSWNISFDFSEDQSLFTNETLAEYDGVMFVLNSDEVLDDAGQAALQTYFQSGGVYTGVHSGSACLQNDTNYQQAVGAIFDYHPQLQSATFLRLDDTFPATADLPDRWTYTEEVYYFRSDPRSVGATVVMTVDNSSFVDDGSSTGNYPSQGSPHPIAWYIESPLSAQPLLPGAPQAGRSFYTSLGHLNTTWQNVTFQNHLMAGLQWALDGGSTKAYGVGLVGNSTSASGTSNGTTSTTTSGASGSSGAGEPSATSNHSGADSGGSGIVKSAAMGAVGVGIGLVAGLTALS